MDKSFDENIHENECYERFESYLSYFNSPNRDVHVVLAYKEHDKWESILTPNQYSALRLKATEPKYFSEKSPGELEYELKRKFGTKFPKNGCYDCMACGNHLYTAASKFESNSGWPAFSEVSYTEYMIKLL